MHLRSTTPGGGSDRGDHGANMERRELIDHIAEQLAAIERPHPVRVAIDGVGRCRQDDLRR